MAVVEAEVEPVKFPVLTLEVAEVVGVPLLGVAIVRTLCLLL